MSLQAWYPLDGNLKNYGVGQLNPTVSTTLAYADGGKIGAKALATGGFTWTAAQTASVLNNTAVSFAFWIKPLNTSSGQIFGTGGMGANNNRKFAIFAYPNGNDLHLSWMNDAADATFVGGVWSGVFPANKWTHCCITYNNPTVTIYINGVKHATTSGISNSSSFSYETQVIHSSSNRYISDFRVYNHCLNPREVKLLSQALIMHYPLTDNAIEGTTNLAPYPTPGSSATAAQGWNQTLHPDAINVSGWGAGYNGGVSANGVKNPEVGYHANWQLIDGLPTMVFPNINSAYNSTGRWLGISGAGGLQDDIGANKTYTVSFDAKGSVDGMTINSGYYYRLTGASGNNFHDGQVDTVLSTSWKRYSYTKTTKSNIDTSVSGSFYFYGHYGKEGISYVRNIQIEIKDHPTAYTVNTRTPILMDCSGYGRHGTVVGALSTSSDAPRYENSTYWSNGSTNYGKSGAVSMPTDAITMSFWFKSSSAGHGSYHIPISFNASDYECSIDSSGQFRNGYAINGSRIVDNTSTSILDGKWHMLTSTYDGATIRRYLDGTEIPNSSHAASGTLRGGTGQLLLGNYNTTTYGNKDAYMSDVRIYATALSADDIKTLYNSRIAMLDNGTTMAYRFTESSTSKLQMGADGIIKADNISELDHIAEMKTQVLPDGSAWARIYWLKTSDTASFFTNAAEVDHCINKTNRYSRMGFVDKFKGSDGYYEFILNYPQLSKTLRNRWKQTNSPNAAHKSGTGHVKIETAWETYAYPLTKSGTPSSAVYATNISDNWWSPIGQIADFSGGIPATDGSTQKEIELWVRIDKLPTITKTSMLDNRHIQAVNIYEI